jgi:hypothetical protein
MVCLWERWVDEQRNQTMIAISVQCLHKNPLIRM